MKVGIIGFGNMGASIYKTLKNKHQIYVSEKNLDRISKYKINNIQLDEKLELDYIILAIKPKDLASFSTNWKGKYISILAGVDTSTLKNKLKVDKVIRLMPNIGLTVGKGIAGVYFDGIDGNEKEKDRSFLNEITKIVEVSNQDLIDSITSLSGSGPAFVFMFFESMVNAGIRIGLDRETASILVEETILGSIELIKKTKNHPAHLKEIVASPAGTTIEGIAKLEEKGFRSSIIEAVYAAYQKAKKIN
ncbi:MAG TPA: pyrroline-5-carboxylate reductase [Spirochaetota bacterium]|nr:pyrroline-5-carboxylate reductase [Spirochaetota bacterium]HOM37617.1 pyrroline-5-carboxylate reductase [Spirochaetota bacterium]HPQ49412.1 pyrroline-5-carboxylate reductase [Spirochaetota bacterium]